MSDSMILRWNAFSVRSLLVVLAAIGVIIVPPAVAGEHGRTGFIVGTLLDIDGEAAEGVSVSVVNEDPLRYRQVGTVPQPKGETDQEGRFRIGPLEPGSYSVFVFGSKDYLDYRARPSQGVVVKGGVSDKVVLRYEQSVQIEISMDAPTKWFGLQGRYWVRTPHRPLVSGLPTFYGMPDFKKSSIGLTTLPGIVELSMDPSFSDGAEIFTYHVDPDGSFTGPQTIPPPKLAPVRFVLSRTDGEKIGRYRIRLHLAAFTSPSIGPSVSNFVVFEDRKDRQIVHVTRGVVARAFVSAEGCEFAESKPFTALPGMDPVQITLKPAKMAEVTIEPNGLPPELDSKASFNSYQWSYRSRSGGMVPWVPLKTPEGDPSKSFNLSGLPEGTEFFMRFWVGGDRKFRGSLEFRAIDGERLAFPLQPVDQPSKKNEAEQGGADQPATASESRPEGSKKPKPESEGRSQ